MTQGSSGQRTAKQEASQRQQMQARGPLGSGQAAAVLTRPGVGNGQQALPVVQELQGTCPPPRHTTPSLTLG